MTSGANTDVTVRFSEFLETAGNLLNRKNSIPKSNPLSGTEFVPKLRLKRPLFPAVYEKRNSDKSYEAFRRRPPYQSYKHPLFQTVVPVFAGMIYADRFIRSAFFIRPSVLQRNSGSCYQIRTIRMQRTSDGTPSARPSFGRMCVVFFHSSEKNKYIVPYQFFIICLN